MTHKEAFEMTIQKAKDFRDGRIKLWCEQTCVMCNASNMSCNKCMVTKVCYYNKRCEREGSLLGAIDDCRRDTSSSTRRALGTKALKYLYTRRGRLRKQGHDL